MDVRSVSLYCLFFYKDLGIEGISCLWSRACLVRTSERRVGRLDSIIGDLLSLERDPDLAFHHQLAQMTLTIKRGLVGQLLLSPTASLLSLAVAQLSPARGLAVLSVEAIIKAVAFDLLVQRRIQKPVVLLDERLMRSAVQAELAALAKGLCAPVDATDEGLLVRVGVLVFAEVLGQRENLAAELAGEGLLPTVDVEVPLQRELGCEALRAFGVLALVHSRGVLFGRRG